MSAEDINVRLARLEACITARPEQEVPDRLPARLPQSPVEDTRRRSRSPRRRSRSPHRRSRSPHRRSRSSGSRPHRDGRVTAISNRLHSLYATRGYYKGMCAHIRRYVNTVHNSYLDRHTSPAIFRLEDVKTGLGADGRRINLTFNPKGMEYMETEISHLSGISKRDIHQAEPFVFWVTIRGLGPYRPR